MKQLGRRSFFSGLAGIGVALGLVKAKKKMISYGELEEAYNDAVIGSEYPLTFSRVHPVGARYTDEAGRTFQLVTRSWGDSFQGSHEDIQGKLVYWMDRKNLVVSAYGGPHPAGVASGEIAPGHQGFIEEVYWHGQKPVETVRFHGIPIQFDQHFAEGPVEEQIECAYRDASETLLATLAKKA